MKRFLFAVAVLSLAACEVALGEGRIEASPPDMASLVEQGHAHRLLVGTPEGKAVLFKPGGVYTAAEEADPAVIAARRELGVVAMNLGDLAAEASGWQEAEAAISAYVASPPHSVRGLPSYVIEQVAAQTLYRHFEADFLNPKNAEAAVRYVDFLVDGRYPDPTPAYRFVAAVGDKIGPERRRRIASGALEAARQYERAVQDSETSIGCAGCLSRQAGLGGSWADSKNALAKMALAR